MDLIDKSMGGMPVGTQGPFNYLLKVCSEWLNYNECNFGYNQSSANTVIYLPIRYQSSKKGKSVR